MIHEMPKVSRFKLEHATEEKLVKTLNLILSKVTKEEAMERFLLSLMTRTERLMLAKRIAVIIFLKEGLPESHIAQTLHVTRVTVARMRLMLEARGEGYDVAFRILENEKLMDELKKKLVDLANYSTAAAGGYIKSPFRVS